MIPDLPLKRQDSSSSAQQYISKDSCVHHHSYYNVKSHTKTLIKEDDKTDAAVIWETDDTKILYTCNVRHFSYSQFLWLRHKCLTHISGPNFTLCQQHATQTPQILPSKTSEFMSGVAYELQVKHTCVHRSACFVKWVLWTNVCASSSVSNHGISQWRPGKYINLHFEKIYQPHWNLQQFPLKIIQNTPNVSLMKQCDVCILSWRCGQ